MIQPVVDPLYDQLKREVDLLGRALGKAIVDLSGQQLFALEEDVRALSKHLRQHQHQSQRRKLLRLRRRLNSRFSKHQIQQVEVDSEK